LLLLCCFGAIEKAHSQIDVWVDFTSDFHDGNNGASNGVADWIDEMTEATNSVGATAFSASERSVIESNILDGLRLTYAGYNVNFVTSQPTSVHDVIYMGRDDDHPSVSTTNLGSAPLDIGNLFTNGYTIMGGNPPGVPKVMTSNFGGFIETFESRAQQISEFSTAIAGTTGHELGHTPGLLHHFVYSAPSIGPSNYSNTNGAQNKFLMATGSTGLNEVERETHRGLSPFSRVMLDITGGASSQFTGQNTLSMVSNPVFSNTEENDSSATTDVSDAPSVGDNYWLVTSLVISVPEPSSQILLLISGLACIARRRRNSAK